MPYPLGAPPPSPSGSRVRLLPPLGCPGPELLIDPLAASPAAINVDWGDGSTEVVPWPVISREPPRPRHYYAARADVTVTVTIGALSAALAVALLGCPVAPEVQPARLRPLLAGGGLSGDDYDGRLSRTWQVRVHPTGGLALQLDAATGRQALALSARPARIYSGSGPPPSGLSPSPIAGDFFLDLLDGRVYEFT